MADKINKKAESAKVESTKAEYTLDDLGQDIRNQYAAEEQKDGERKMRDKHLYLKVLQHLLDIVKSVKEDNEGNRIDSIQLALEKDNSIFGYTCFLTSNSQFDYSWSYLRRQWDKYVESLDSICSFMSRMLADIKFLRTTGEETSGKKVIFAHVFVVSFDKSVPQTEVLWEHFRRLFDVKKGYDVSISVEHVILLSAFCKYQESESGLENLWKKHLGIEVKHNKDAKNKGK